jgi:riboflavin biosynthesis pyrimidine reductase
VEGGGEILGSLLDEGRIDEVWSFFAPMLVGGNKPSFAGQGVEGPDQAAQFDPIRYKRIGQDLLAIGLLLKGSPTR